MSDDSDARGFSRPKALAAWVLGYNAPQLAAGMVGAALPIICADLGVTPADGLWLVNAFGLTSTIAILPGAALSDSLGYKRVFVAGVAVLAAAAAAGALVPLYPVLVASRFLQGLGAGIVLACLGHFVRATYPPERVGRGLAFNATMVAASSAGGPALAALILAVADWRWVFAASALQGLLCLVMARPYLKASPGSPRAMDRIAVVYNAVAVGALILAVQEMAAGRRAVVVLTELATAVLSGLLFIRRELRQERPMLAVDLIRIPIIRLSVVTMGLCFAAFGMVAAALPFYLHLHNPGSPLRLGLLLAAQPIGAMMMGPVAGRLSDRYPVGLVGGCGMALAMAGVLLIALAPADASFWNLFWRILVVGIGYALFGPTNTRGMIMGAPADRTGAATGLNAAMRSLSFTVGGAAAALVFGIAAGGEATTASTLAVFYVAAGLGIAGGGLSLARATMR